MKKTLIRLCAVAAGLTLSACAVPVSPQRTMRFLGDSITVQSEPDIAAHYANDNVTVTATIGWDTYLQEVPATVDAKAAPNIEIINLGTNDASRIAANVGLGWLEPTPPTLPDVLARFDTMAGEFPPTTCVIFVTVNTHNPSWGPDAARAINDHIKSTFAHVADWDAAYNPSYFDALDNPHPNEVGRQALLKLEDAAIGGCR